jgi:hypothetical protein
VTLEFSIPKFPRFGKVYLLKMGFAQKLEKIAFRRKNYPLSIVHYSLFFREHPLNNG